MFVLKLHLIKWKTRFLNKKNIVQTLSSKLQFQIVMLPRYIIYKTNLSSESRVKAILTQQLYLS